MYIFCVYELHQMWINVITIYIDTVALQTEVDYKWYLNVTGCWNIRVILCTFAETSRDGNTDISLTSHIRRDDIGFETTSTYLLMNILTTTKEQDHSWETDSRSINQEITYLLRNPEFHYYDHNSSPLATILTVQLSPHIMQSQF